MILKPKRRIKPETTTYVKLPKSGFQKVEEAAKVTPFNTFSILRYIKKYEIITTEEDLKKLAHRMMFLDAFAFDTETNTLRVNADNPDFRLVDISISWGRHRNYMIPIGHVFDDNQLDLDIIVKYLRPVFQRLDVTIIGSNIKFDMHVMKRIGIHIITPHIFCDMCAGWLCDENLDKGLKAQTKDELGIDQEHFGDVLKTVTSEEKKSVGRKANVKATFDLVRIMNAKDYVLADPYFSWSLYLIYIEKLEEEGMTSIYFRTYPKFIRVLFNMEERGICIDLDTLEEMGSDMQADLDQLEYEIFELAGIEFNPNSSQQKAELLFSFDGSEVFVEKKNKKTGKMEKVPVYKNPNYNIIEMGFDFPIEKYTDAKAPSTDGTTILHLSKKEYKTARKREGVQLCKKLLEYSKLEKLKTGFVDGIKENIYPDGKIHCNFHPVGTDSGRISCSNINLMQLPNAREDDKYRLRDVFIGDIDPKTGKRKKIISVDESNLEMRVLTHFSQDEALLKAFNNNDDTHGATAVQMFNLPIKPNEVKKHPVYGYLRQIAKIINFMLMYGGGAPTLYDALKEEGVDMDNPQEWAKYTITVKGKTRKVKNGIELAQAYIDRYFKAYSGVAKFIQNQKRFAHRNGLVYTLVGRKRRLPNIQSDNFKVVSYCERLSVNSCIQGSGADIVINAQNKIEYDERLWNLDCEMLIQVHDELICQAPEENAEEAAQIIREHMIHPFGQSVKLNLPLEVGIGIGDSYGTAEH